MKQLFKFIGMLSIFMALCALVGCTYLTSDDEDQPYQAFYDEPYDNACQATPGVPYEIAPSIGVYVHDAASGEGDIGGFRKLAPGDYVVPDVDTPMRIKVSPRLVDDMPMDQRVFVGGCGDYYTEAILDENGEYYVCNYVFEDKYLTFPLLIKVLYPEGFAAKSKLMVTTRQNDKPEAGYLVKNGLHVVLSKGLADKLRPGFSALVAGSEVKELRPAINENADEQGVLHLDVPDLIKGDLILFDTDADGVRGINLGFENIERLVGNRFLGLIGGLLLNGKPLLSKGAKYLNMGDTLKGLGDSDDGEVSMIGSVMKGLEMDSLLFLNIAGVPEETDADFAAIGLGLYATNSGSVIQMPDDPETGEPVYLWPEVEEDLKYIPDKTEAPDVLIDWDLLKTYEAASGEQKETDLGIAMTEYNMNHFLSNMMEHFYILLEGDLIKSLASLVVKVSPSSLITMGLTINPDGIAMDLNPHEQSVAMILSDPDFHPGGKGLFTINDMQAEILENGTPVTLLSMDLTMEMGISVQSAGEEDLNLVVELLPIYDLCHVHVMNDSKGLSVLDNSGLLPMIFEMVAGGEGKPFVMTISLAGQGMRPIADFENTGGVKFDDLGNCFMNLALKSFDTSGICFITSAGL